MSKASKIPPYSIDQKYLDFQLVYSEYASSVLIYCYISKWHSLTHVESWTLYSMIILKMLDVVVTLSFYFHKLIKLKALKLVNLWMYKCCICDDYHDTNIKIKIDLNPLGLGGVIWMILGNPYTIWLRFVLREKESIVFIVKQVQTI